MDFLLRIFAVKKILKGLAMGAGPKNVRPYTFLGFEFRC